MKQITLRKIMDAILLIAPVALICTIIITLLVAQSRVPHSSSASIGTTTPYYFMAIGDVTMPLIEINTVPEWNYGDLKSEKEFFDSSRKEFDISVGTGCQVEATTSRTSVAIVCLK